MEDYRSRCAIRNWAEDDRPREKFMLKGRHSLTDAELLAILIVSGTRHDSAVDLARKILEMVHGNLAELSRFNIQELMRIRGIGLARSITILASLELGRRRDESEVMEKQKINSSREAYQLFRSVLGDSHYEEFWILLLNRANRVIRRCNISEGGISSTLVDPKKIFKISLDHRASGIILAHNHPSGTLQPSEADIKLTRQLCDGGKLLEIQVLDHLIITANGYYSFSDSNELG